MQTTDIPTRFPIPFANGAGGSYIRPIPTAHVAASGSDAPASLYDGFPPETFTPVSSGGVPPNGKDFNGLFNQITAWARWQAAGAPSYYDAAFSTAINGYPKGSRLTSTADASILWVSTADNNTTNPDGGSPANWAKFGTITGNFVIPKGHFDMEVAPRQDASGVVVSEQAEERGLCQLLGKRRLLDCYCAGGLGISAQCNLNLDSAHRGTEYEARQIKFHLRRVSFNESEDCESRRACGDLRLPVRIDT